MRTYARASRIPAARTGMRTVSISIAALTALGIMVPLAGCGSGSKGNLGTVNGVSRKQGTMTITVVWPERTRLIPKAANSIVVGLTRTPDADFPNPIVKPPVTLTRPAPGQPLVTKATFTNLELGTYSITATAYPGNNGPGVPNPTTGDNVPVATTKTAGTVVVVPGVNNPPPITMSTTIAALTPTLPEAVRRVQKAAGQTDDDFKQTLTRLGVSTTFLGQLTSVDLDPNIGIISLIPGNTVTLNAIPKDDTPATANPPGPYTVPIQANSLRYSIVTTDPNKNPDNLTLKVDAVTGQVSSIVLKDKTKFGTAFVRITEPESKITSDVPILVSPPATQTDPWAPEAKTFGTPDSQWSRFHGNSQHTGQVVVTNQVLNNVGAPGWPFFTTSEITFSSPTITKDGTIYIGTVTKELPPPSPGGDRKFFAINPDGSQKWVFDDNGAMGDINGTATVAQNGVIYIGSANGFVYALRDNGKAAAPTLVWKKQLSGPIVGSIALGEDNIAYVATDATDTASGQVYALSGFTGNPIRVRQVDGTIKDWVYTEVTGGIQSSPALSRDGFTLYVTSSDGGLYGIRTGAFPSDIGGTKRFPRVVLDGGSGILASPVVTKVNGLEKLLVGTLGGKMIQLDAQQGAVEWTYDAAAQIYTTPAVREDPVTGNAQFIYFGTLDNVSGNNDHKVVALDTTGNEVWRTTETDADGNPFFTINGGFTSSPALSKDGKVLYVGCLNGNVYAIDSDPANPDNRRNPIPVAGGGTWVYKAPGSDDPTAPANNIESSPAVDSTGHVYIGGFFGAVYKIGTP